MSTSGAAIAAEFNPFVIAHQDMLETLRKSVRNLQATKWYAVGSPENDVLKNTYAKLKSAVSRGAVQMAADKISVTQRVLNLRRLTRLDFYRNASLHTEGRTDLLAEMRTHISSLALE